MALVKGFLAQSQKMGATPSVSATSPVGGEEEQAKDMCLLCEREFVVAGKVHTVTSLVLYTRRTSFTTCRAVPRPVLLCAGAVRAWLLR